MNPEKRSKESANEPCRVHCSLNSVVRPLRGLEKVCRLYGRMKCGNTMMVWDYDNEVAVKESEMPMGSDRWLRSEKAKWSNKRGES